MDAAARRIDMYLRPLAVVDVATFPPGMLLDSVAPVASGQTRRPCGHLRPAHSPLDAEGIEPTLVSLPDAHKAPQHESKLDGRTPHESTKSELEGIRFLSPDDHHRFLFFRSCITPAHLAAELVSAAMGTVGFGAGVQ